MPKWFKVGLLFAALWLVAIGAFAIGRSTHRVVRHNSQTKDLALYASLLHFAERSTMAPASGGLAKQSDLRPLDVYATAERRLRANYYEKIDDSRVLAFGTADAMVDSLQDPYSRFLEPEQLQSYIDRQTGVYHGIGAVLGVRRVTIEAMRENADEERQRAKEDEGSMPAFDDPADSNSVERGPDGNITARYDIAVVATMPGSPAEAAGLRAGDVIHKVNGKLIFTRNLDSLDQLLLVPDKGSAKISVVRKGSPKQIEMTLNFGTTRVSPVSVRTEAGIGIVSVHTLGAGVADQVKAHVKDLLANGAKGIVLDLRRDGDGDCNEAVSLANAFIPSGSVAAFKERGGKWSEVQAAPGSALPKVPKLAVLSDQTTAGPAELVAGALKARKVATLFGGTTEGRGSRQEIFKQAGGSAALLTTALFYEPLPGPAGSVGAIEGKGVTPDVAVAPREGKDDLALQRALAWMKNGAA